MGNVNNPDDWDRQQKQFETMFVIMVLVVAIILLTIFKSKN